MTRDRLNHRPLFVEALEDRTVLNATVALVGGGQHLKIVGDDAAESVCIVQNDATDTLTVTCGINNPYSLAPAQVQTFRSSDIKKITINLGGGDDRLIYTLESDTFDFAKQIKVDLGAGNDLAKFIFAGEGIQQAIPLPNGDGGPGADDQGQGIGAEQPGLSEGEPIDAIFIGNLGPAVQVGGGVGGQGVDGQDVGGGLIDQNADATLLWTISGWKQIRAALDIDVSAGKGDDTVVAKFGSVDARGSVNYKVAFGEGNDVGDVQLFGEIAGSMAITHQGNKGADQLSVEGMGGNSVAEGGILGLKQYGGKGNDAISFNYAGLVRGLLEATSRGKAGDDTISHSLNIDYRSTGQIRSHVFGDGGLDTLTNDMHVDLPVLPPILPLFCFAPVDLAGTLDGGDGLDLGQATSNVTVSSVENFSLLM